MGRQTTPHTSQQASFSPIPSCILTDTASPAPGALIADRPGRVHLSNEPRHSGMVGGWPVSLRGGDGTLDRDCHLTGALWPRMADWADQNAERFANMSEGTEGGAFVNLEAPRKRTRTRTEQHRLLKSLARGVCNYKCTQVFTNLYNLCTSKITQAWCLKTQPH